MIEVESNHFRIVGGSLTGEREVYEQTFSSLAVLGERLERLKEHYDGFSGITFSDHVGELQARKSAVPMG